LHADQVQAFYQQMGSVMAQRCDELGASQGQQGGGNQSASRKAAKPAAAAVSLPSQGAGKKKQHTCRIEEVT